MTLLAIVIGATLLSWTALSAIALALVVHFRRDWQEHTARTPPLPETAPEAAIILPIKGYSALTRTSLAAYADLDYPNYRLLVAVEAKNDAAYAPASELASRLPDRVQVVVAGHAMIGVQKTVNQLAAWQKVAESAQVICLADADELPPREWLTRLVSWIMTGPERVMASGYRWLVPADAHPATLTICMINEGIATLTRDQRWNLAWGGAMGAHRKLWVRIDPERTLRGVATDDLVLGRGARQHGGHIEQVRDLLVISPVAMNWQSGVSFLRRQYTLLRMYAPAHWALAASVTTWAVGGWVVTAWALILGWFWALLPAGCVFALDASRLCVRRRFAADKWPKAPLGYELRRGCIVKALAMPLVSLIHAACIWSTLMQKRFKWAGVLYDVSNPYAVMVVRREAAEDGSDARITADETLH